MRSDSENFQNLDRHDQWLAKYTYENLDKWPSEETIRILLSRYPNEKAMTLYRGLNFRTKERYDAFMDGIVDGKVEIKGVSSWSPTREGARQFAMVQPTYYPDRETFQQEKLAREAGEQLRGYRGVVLKTHIDAGQGIKVNKSGLGHESEIALPPKTYTVEVEVIRTYGEQFESGERNVSDFVRQLASKDDIDGGEASEIFTHIRASQMHRLTEEDKDKLFQILKPHSDETFTHEQTKYSAHYTHGEREKILSFIYHRVFFAYYEEGMFGDDHDDEVKAIARKVLSDFLVAAKAHPDHELLAYDMRSLGRIAADGRLRQFVKDRYAAKYQALNSREEIDRVNKEDDLFAAKKRIESLMQEMARFL